MNWREGLARIWLILSVLWISGLFGFVIYIALDNGWSVDETVTRLISVAPYAVILCFGPSLLLFILYKMVCWIIAGFHLKQREDNSSLDE